MQNRISYVSSSLLFIFQFIVLSYLYFLQEFLRQLQCTTRLTPLITYELGCKYWFQSFLCVYVECGNCKDRKDLERGRADDGDVQSAGGVKKRKRRREEEEQSARFGCTRLSVKSTSRQRVLHRSETLDDRIRMYQQCIDEKQNTWESEHLFSLLLHVLPLLLILDPLKNSWLYPPDSLNRSDALAVLLARAAAFLRFFFFFLRGVGTRRGRMALR